MKFRVTSGSVNLETWESNDFLVPLAIEHVRAEVIDTEMNEIFARCRSAWDVEDQLLAYWNRLNTHDEAGPFCCTHPTEKVIVLRVEEMK